MYCLPSRKTLMRLPRKLHPQGVPLVGGYRSIDVLDRVPAAARRVVERNVVLQSIGPRHVVVVAILEAPDDAACAVLPTLHRLELHLHKSVGEGDVLLGAPRERALARLLQYVRFAGRGAVGLDCPLGRAAACDAAYPACRGRARRVLVEPDGFCQCRSRADRCDVLPGTAVSSVLPFNDSSE